MTPTRWPTGRPVRPPFPDAAFDVVVVAASHGGPRALIRLLAALPADFPAAITVVQHRSARYPSHLDELLRRRTALGVETAAPGEHLMPGVVHLAPPGRHLLVRAGGALALSDGPPVRFVRPRADLLFASAAEHFRERALGVVLTGRLDDGAAGARTIKLRGGRVLAQDEATCDAFGMPGAAVAAGGVDFVLPLDTIASALVTLVMVPGAAPLFRVPLAPPPTAWWGGLVAGR